MDFNLNQKQVQTLSPQMIQSVQILQMGIQELREYVEEIVYENPVLEMDDSCPKHEEEVTVRQEMDWLESTDSQNRYYYNHGTDNEDDPLHNISDDTCMQEDLCKSLTSQLKEKKLSQKMYENCVFLVQSLNRYGWLDETIAELAQEKNCSEDMLLQALKMIQGLEPAGIGARSLEECLNLQLKQKDHPSQQLAIQIVEKYLDALGKYHYSLIAHTLKCTVGEVRAASELIRTLEPKPGLLYSNSEKTMYITPDLIVTECGGELELRINSSYLPVLNISQYYIKMMREREDRELKEYLNNKVSQAKWVINAIEQRQSTLQMCAVCILKFQREFFRRGPGHLMPLTLEDIAGLLQIHESTVSRALKGKYLQCSWGVYPLAYFFPSTVRSSDSGGEFSADAAKAMLRSLIDGEDKKKPYSDQKLCNMMEEAGYTISRRTVAKYREEMNIPSTIGRKNEKTCNKD